MPLNPLTSTIRALRNIGGGRPQENGQEPSVGYRHRLLLNRLESGHINSIADAHEAREAARRLGRRDLERRAERIQRSLARR